MSRVSSRFQCGVVSRLLTRQKAQPVSIPAGSRMSLPRKLLKDSSHLKARKTGFELHPFVPPLQKRALLWSSLKNQNSWCLPAGLCFPHQLSADSSGPLAPPHTHTHTHNPAEPLDALGPCSCRFLTDLPASRVNGPCEV